MKREAYYAIGLAIVTVILTSNGIMSHSWYTEDRSDSSSSGTLESKIGYGLLDVHNETRVIFNKTVINTSDEYQSYESFIASNATRARDAGSTMFLISIVGLILSVLFIPLVFLAHQGYFDDKMGKAGPYLPLIIAQIAALILIFGALWFSYAFPTGLDADAAQLHQERYQALGGKTGLWVLVGGFLIQLAALLARARTQLIYIEPLGEVKPAEPLE